VISALRALLFLISAGLVCRVMIAVARKKWSLNSRQALSAFFLISLVVATVLVTSYHGLHIFKVEESSSLFEAETFFGIMFDAGSTGSRVHVFKFKKSTEGMKCVLLFASYLVIYFFQISETFMMRILAVVHWIFRGC